MSAHCRHLHSIQEVTPSARGCEECLRTGDVWVHLRLCRTCGHVGCCDQSPQQARDRALRSHPASDHRSLRSARRVGMVLRGRDIHRPARPDPAMGSDTPIHMTILPVEPGKSLDAFPRLSAEMIDRIEPFGKVEQLEQGTLLYRVGDRNVDFFLVLAGAVEILDSDGRGGHAHVVSHEAREFTGELDHLSGRAVIVSARASRPSRVIRITTTALRRLFNAEPDIGEIILQAYILRRKRLLQRAQGGIVLVGSIHTADTARIQRFLTRNGYPFRLLDTDSDPEAAIVLRSFRASSMALPLVIRDGRTVLENPPNSVLAAALGITEDMGVGEVHDVIVVGAGPAGLAAAVYAASEGLETLVIESLGPGGQAGSSSRIENYLGFPTGISGQELATRAQIQAQKFGARFAIAQTAASLDCSTFPFRLHLSDQQVLAARAVVVASGVRYRQLDVPDLARFQGQGVHYAATSVESRLCMGDDVIVVGGGNSAGQAAIYLASHAKHVHMLIRGPNLAATMSDYLIRRIESSAHITLHTQTVVSGLFGKKYLEAVGWRERDGPETLHPTANLFSMIGAVPNTDWLKGCVVLDSKGFVKTGHAIAGVDTTGLYETSVPGVFAVGDVRMDSVKRVAASVGEGSVVVRMIHPWLASTRLTEFDGH